MLFIAAVRCQVHPVRNSSPVSRHLSLLLLFVLAPAAASMHQLHNTSNKPVLRVSPGSNIKNGSRRN